MGYLSYYKLVVLPDGRIVEGTIRGHREYDTNAWVDDVMEFAWLRGEELTADECNEEIEIDGKKYFAWEYVAEQTVLSVPEAWVDEL